MALTPEQQTQLEFEVSRDSVRYDHEKLLEETRKQNNLDLEHRRAKLEAIRLAKEMLVENSRSKPVDSRDVSAEDIKNFAEVLVNYVNK